MLNVECFFHVRFSFLLSSLWLPPRKNRCESEAGDKNRHADPLRGREAEMVMEIGIIAAEVFDDRARDGVAKQIRRKNLAVEFLAPEQPRQKQIEREVQQRVVNFRRMQRQVERCPRKVTRP